MPHLSPIILWSTVLLSLFSLPAVADPAEIAAGERVFRNQCLGCHSIGPGENRAGPTLHGLFGRLSGTVEGFDFSPAMRQAGIEWTPDTLDAFLTSPRDVVPNTKMVFWGLPKADRRRVISYLESTTE